MTRITERIEPRRELAPVYDRLFEAYLALYPATAPTPAAAEPGCRTDDSGHRGLGT